jgi:cytochrome c oxidase subunit 3
MAEVVRIEDSRRGEKAPPPSGFFDDPARILLWAFLGTVCMLFIGFTSAYIVRRGGADWQPVPLPWLLWVNTAVLFASSVTVELARRRQAAWRLAEVRPFVDATGALGFLFLAGQVMAWQQLRALGVFLASNPHSSFFYLLTGVHGLHLLGGLVWLARVAARARRLAVAPGTNSLALFATYWHFLAGLWIYLLLLLFVF